MTFSRFSEGIKRRIRNFPNRLAWYFPLGFSKRNKTNLIKFKNKHKGERCFIIANGPSLNKIDFNLLKDEFTIGMNRIYLMKEKINFLPTYLVSVDGNCQLKQFSIEYDNLNIPCFFSWNNRNLFMKKDNQNFIKIKYNLGFSKDIVKQQNFNGASVTFNCMELAYYMGFKEVYLIGKDHNYDTDIKPGKLIRSTGEESNHFIKGYYNPGQVWASPCYDIEEMAYGLAKKAFEDADRIIKDATIDGKLKIFEKCDFYSLFKKN